MKRRKFIQNMSLAAVATPTAFDKLIAQSFEKLAGSDSFRYGERVLIIIRLNGGNDGLNMVIPVSQYSNLGIQRSNILIPQNDVLSLTNDVGLHPEMTGMQGMFNDGKLSIIHNVGYPDQNRSHFRSMDIWTSGLIDSPATTGWLGRHFDDVFPNFPDNYPNPGMTDPIAISMGYHVSATCQGLMGNFSHSVSNPLDNFNLATTNIVDDGTYYGNQVKYLATIIEQSNKYGTQINVAATNGNTLSTKYDPDNRLAMQLQNVARMISGGLKTKVYILNVNGFDTHNEQIDSTGVTIGFHAELLKMLSDGISAFQDDLKLLGLEEQVLGLTFSEFGRQIASNASYGTDHGDAGPMFLFGSCVNNSEVGTIPNIPNQVVEQAAIPMEHDFRDIYGSVLNNWFGVSQTDVQTLFEVPINFMNLATGCVVNSVDEPLSIATSEALIYPNPCFENATIRLNTLNEKVIITVLDMNGSIVINVFNGSLAEGEHNLPMQLNSLPIGNYVIRVEKESGVVVKNLIKA